MSIFRVGAGRVDADNVAEIKVNVDGTQLVEITNLNADLDSQIDAALTAGKSFVAAKKYTLGKSKFLGIQLTIPDANTTLFFVDWSVAVEFPASLLINEGGTLSTPTAVPLQNRNRNSVTASGASLGTVNNSATNPITGGNTIYENYLAFEKQLEPSDAGLFIAKNNTTYVLLIEQSKLSDSVDSFKFNITEIAA